jgi:hypothetical protein
MSVRIASMALSVAAVCLLAAGASVAQATHIDHKTNMQPLTHFAIVNPNTHTATYFIRGIFKARTECRERRTIRLLHNGWIVDEIKTGKDRKAKAGGVDPVRSFTFYSSTPFPPGQYVAGAYTKFFKLQGHTHKCRLAWTEPLTLPLP